MSSYRGAWDGGPPGAEGEYPPPATDPWTGASYAQYPAYQYAAYGYGYDPAYYQRAAECYSAGAYPGTAYPAGPAPPPPSYERDRAADDYARRAPSYPRGRRTSRSPARRASRSPARRTRSPERRHTRSPDRRTPDRRKKRYSSSDRSSSRSRSFTPVKDKRKRRRSSDSSISDRSYDRTDSRRRKDRSLTPPVKKYHSRDRSESPGTPESRARRASRSTDSRDRSAKDKKDKKRREVATPPRKRKGSVTPERKRSDRKGDRPSVSPPKSYKYKDRDGGTPPRKARDSSVTPPKSYARNSSASSKSRSATPARPRRRSSSSHSHSSESSRRSRSKKRKTKRKSISGHRSRSGSSARRSRSASRRHSAERDRATPSDDEQRRGQFTVTDRKRFWKMHNSRHEERSKTPPKEAKPPPPGAVEPTALDDIEYGDPPDLEGPNFAELLPPPDLAALALASASKAKAVPIPIKNDGSFLEMFKKMQEVTKKMEEEKKPEMKKPTLPFIGKRRGGRVLKTGLVKKAKAIDEQTVDNTPKDAWSLYMQEVKKYRETSCEEERKTRPLVNKMPEQIKSVADIKTAPFDPRFPNTNQTRHCYQSYLDFHRCQKVRGEKYEPCQYFKRVYRSMCPNEWVDKWDTQREEGTFPGRI